MHFLLYQYIPTFPPQNSLEVCEALVERSVSGAPPLTKYQFERVGYFCVDFDTTKDKVFVYRLIEYAE